MYTSTTVLLDRKLLLSRCSSKTRTSATAPRHCTTDLLFGHVMRARAAQQLAQYAEEVRSADWNSKSWGSRPEKLSQMMMLRHWCYLNRTGSSDASNNGLSWPYLCWWMLHAICSHWQSLLSFKRNSTNINNSCWRFKRIRVSGYAGTNYDY